MAKKFSCWLGRHTWTTHTEKGESYKVCSACGKTPRNSDGAGGDQYPSMYPQPPG